MPPCGVENGNVTRRDRRRVRPVVSINRRDTLLAHNPHGHRQRPVNFISMTSLVVTVMTQRTES